MNSVVSVALLLISGLSLAASQPPYAGLEKRSIKSMSAQEIESLRSGDGMGFALPAELNHYPGPKHVLELADALDLTSAQISESRMLFAEMRSKAVAHGGALLDAEFALDQKFAHGEIGSDELKEALLEIGRIQAHLRFVHLEAHLRQRNLLTAEQIAEYDEMRGYHDALEGHADHSMHHE